MTQQKCMAIRNMTADVHKKPEPFGWLAGWLDGLTGWFDWLLKQYPWWVLCLVCLCDEHNLEIKVILANRTQNYDMALQSRRIGVLNLNRIHTIRKSIIKRFPNSTLQCATVSNHRFSHTISISIKALFTFTLFHHVVDVCSSTSVSSTRSIFTSTFASIRFLLLPSTNTFIHGAFMRKASSFDHVGG